MKRLAVLLFLPCVSYAGPIDDLAEMMQGRFDTHPAGRDVAADPATRLVDSRQRADAPEIGEVVFYLQLNQKKELELYRQRILVFTVEDGVTVQKAYVLNEPEKYVDARTGDDVLTGLSPEDIEPMFQEGCATTWSMIHGSFRGYTDPATCRIISGRTGKPRRIESEAILTEDTLYLVERGYDDDMNQLFGTPLGEHTVLYRVP